MSRALDAIRKGVAHHPACPIRILAEHPDLLGDARCVCTDLRAVEHKPQRRRSIGDQWAESRF